MFPQATSRFPNKVFQNRSEELLTHKSRETPEVEVLLCSQDDLLSFHQDLE